MQKVLITAPSFDTGRNVSGVSAVTAQIMYSLRGSVDFVHLQIGQEQIGTKVGRLFRSIVRTAIAIYIILCGRYDAIHSNTALNRNSIIRDTLLMTIAAIRRKNLVLHLHGGFYIHNEPPFLLKRLISGLFYLANTIIVLSNVERVYVTGQFPRYASKFLVIYNGVRVSQRNDRTFQGDGTLRVGYIGRLVEEKGINILIEAISNFDDRDPIKFEIFGEGKFRSSVEALSLIKRNVRFNGVFASTQIADVLASIDVLVLPSLNGEGMPMVVVEAMMAGVIPLCTPISSIPEIIDDGGNGFLFAPGSTLALTTMLRELSKKKTNLTTVSSNARDFAQRYFDGDKNYSVLLNVYLKSQ